MATAKTTQQKRDDAKADDAKANDTKANETGTKADTAKASNSGAGEMQTTQQKRESDESKTTESKEAETNAVAASDGERGAVVRGDTGLDDEENEDFALGEDSNKDDEDGIKGQVGGTVREGKEDVPYVYLTPDMLGSKVRTSDADDDRVRSWNVQTTEEDENGDGVPVALVPVEAEPGQTFAVHELPNVDVLKAAGIDPAQLLSGLPVRLADPDLFIRPGSGANG